MKYPCPMCKVELQIYVGSRLHPGESDYGITMGCINKECPAQEVLGHGKNEKEAFEIILDKFVRFGNR